MKLNIRNAEERDCLEIMELLHQVNDIHADGRPDLFIHGCTKYTLSDLSEIIKNPLTPVFVAIDDSGRLAGYCFCVIEDHADSNNLRKVKTLYIDDLCVNEKCRGKHAGLTIYGYVKEFAKASGVYNITLNVWSRNTDAIKFYESLGMQIQKIGMEEIL